MEISSESETHDNTEVPGWCICGICRQLPDDVENKCCRKRQCVTSLQVFHQAIVNRAVLEVAMKIRFDMFVETADFQMSTGKQLTGNILHGSMEN